MSELEMTEREQAPNIASLDDLGQKRGYSTEQNVDYGYGVMDTVWKIPIHPSLPEIKCGFVRLRSDEGGGGSQDWQDNQYSIRKIEEALMRGIRSGMDRVYLIADNEDMARSISGRIEWLSSFGSLIRFDALSLGLTPSQDRSSIIVPSQERVPSEEKIRKEEMREREGKNSNSFNNDRDSGCSEYGSAYEDGFSVGCQSVEGNTYDSCELTIEGHERYCPDNPKRVSLH